MTPVTPLAARVTTVAERPSSYETAARETPAWKVAIRKHMEEQMAAFVGHRRWGRRQGGDQRSARRDARPNA